MNEITKQETVEDLAPEKRVALAEMFVGVAPGIMRARAAFLRDLPELLKNSKYDRWCAAYSGDERIALSPSKKEVVQECLNRGLREDEYFFGMVVPYDDEDYEIDQSLYEFDEVV